jgi:hypothetical protein
VTKLFYTSYIRGAIYHRRLLLDEAHCRIGWQFLSLCSGYIGQLLRFICILLARVNKPQFVARFRLNVALWKSPVSQTPSGTLKSAMPARSRKKGKASLLENAEVEPYAAAGELTMRCGAQFLAGEFPENQGAEKWNV